VWAVFANISNVSGPTLGFSPATPPPAGSACNGVDFCIWATVDFDARIFPAQITTDADHPALEGARNVNPPGGNHVCSGNALAGGAPLRWDFSRQVSVAFGGLAAGSCGGGTGFPANNVEGNDDSHAGDEMNDPYNGGAIPISGRAVAAGFMGDTDRPAINLSDALGASGDVVSLTSNFREFVRLEYHRTWWLISRRPTWGVNFLAIKNAAGHWQDNGSTVS
jgi:hypothetical protein